MNKQLVIGLGTGRCGTWSLAKFLGKQEGASIKHEASFLPWDYYPRGHKSVVGELMRLDGGLVGDVGFYWLNYVCPTLDLVPDAKFVCLKRPKSETVESWLRHAGDVNHWTKLGCMEWGVEDRFTNSSFYFPKFELPKKEALEEYWELYYAIAESLVNIIPESFRVVELGDLNDEEGMDGILEFIGVPAEKRVIEKTHANRFGKQFKDSERMPLKAGHCEFCGEADAAEWYVFERSSGMMSYACDECYQANNLGFFSKEEN